MKKSDIRYQKVDNSIVEAFARLLQTKGFEKISVNEITGTAEINRTTFYNHYDGKLSLLEEYAQEKFNKYVATHFNPGKSRWDCLWSLFTTTRGYIDIMAPSCCEDQESIMSHIDDCILKELTNIIINLLHESGNTDTSRFLSISLANSIWGLAKFTHNQELELLPHRDAILSSMMPVATHETQEKRLTGNCR